MTLLRRRTFAGRPTGLGGKAALAGILPGGSSIESDLLRRSCKNKFLIRSVCFTPKKDVLVSEDYQRSPGMTGLCRKQHPCGAMSRSK